MIIIVMALNGLGERVDVILIHYNAAQSGGNLGVVILSLLVVVVVVVQVVVAMVVEVLVLVLWQCW